MLDRSTRYDETKIVNFVELASEIGITRAQRELGYPSSWITGKKWATQRGIDIPVDEVKAKAAEIREWYKNEEKLTICQEGLDRIYQMLTGSVLDPDELNKLSTATKKFIETMNLIEGKATAIAKDEAGAADDMFMDALKKFQEKVDSHQ